MDVPDRKSLAFVDGGYDGTTYEFETTGGKLCCLVCIRPGKKQDNLEVYGLLVHEAVHVWRKINERLNEDNPSSEFEAYALQNIAMRLMVAYDKIKKG